jgi:ABC-2 type transport system permease protein
MTTTHELAHDVQAAAVDRSPAVGALEERPARRRTSAQNRVLALCRRRRTVQLLVARDMKVRYASSTLGYVWSVLEPLLMSLIYWFIFTKVFHRSVGENPYIVFLLSGLLPWAWFTGGLTEGAKALRSEAKLVRSTNLPREVWVLRVVMSKAVEFFLSLPVLFLFVAATGAPLNWRIVLLLPAAVMLAVLLVGLGLLLSPLMVLFNDLERIIKLALRLGFYMSPVVFTVKDVPKPFAGAFAANPLAGIFEMMRAGFFPQQLEWAHVGASAVACVLLLLIGWIVFAKLERPVLKEI